MNFKKLDPVCVQEDDAFLDQHAASCKRRSGCRTCLLAKHYKAFRRQLQMPWLCYLRDHDESGIGVGCLMCSHAGLQTPFALFELKNTELRLSKLRRHEESEAHVKAWQAAAKATGLPGPVVGDQLDSPSYDVFKDALKVRLDGLACKRGLEDHGISSGKLRQLSFCLSEAKRMMLRAWFMNKATTIALQQDERHQRLLLRFTAASNSLERRSGAIGLAKNFGSAAGAISKATEGIVRDFCTPGCLAPDCPAEEAQLNETLLECMRSKVEVMCADAAGDEQKATELLRSRLGPDGRAFFPNIRLGLRDTAHASRRVIKRPFEADKTLSDIMQSIFFGKHSIVAAVENSFLAKNRFEHHVKASNSSKVVESSIRSLSLAKQRFDSTQKPLGRFCLFLQPFLTTVIEMAREKKNDDKNGMRAQAFLAYINEEILLQVGMLADAGDEGSQLCRSFDTELPASEELAAAVDGFIIKISCLFASDEPACLLTGYTNHMIKVLSSREILLPTVDGNGVRALGGQGSITAQLIARCVDRMKSWVPWCCLDPTLLLRGFGGVDCRVG